MNSTGTSAPPGVLTRAWAAVWIAGLLVVSLAVSVALGFVGAEHGVTWRHFNWDIAAVAGTALGTISLAGFTGALAWTTSGDVRATWELANLTRGDQSARERPVVIIQLNSYIPAADDEHLQHRGRSAEMGYLGATAINAGLGPAIDVRVSGVTERGEAVREQVISVLGPGAEASLNFPVLVDRAALPDPNTPLTIALRGTFTDRRETRRDLIKYVRPDGVWPDLLD